MFIWCILCHCYQHCSLMLLFAETANMFVILVLVYYCFQFCTFTFPDCTSNPECIFSIVAKICDTECKSETCLTYPSLDKDIPFLDEGFKLAVEDYRKKFDNRTTPEENLTLLQQAQLLKGSYEEQLIHRSHQRLRWLDTVFQGQYLTSLSINYVAINKVLGKLPPQLY